MLFCVMWQGHYICLCRHAYHVAGLVVASCPRLTYSRSDSRCLLPQLVEVLLPSLRQTQPQGATSAVQSQLHLVSGQELGDFYHCCPPPSPSSYQACFS